MTSLALLQQGHPPIQPVLVLCPPQRLSRTLLHPHPTQDLSPQPGTLMFI